MTDITAEQYCSLSPQDRAFYHEHKDDTEMCVYNGKLHFKVRGKPRVTWARFQKLLQLPNQLTAQESEALRISTDFGDWNPYGRPYLDHGFHYWFSIDCSAYGLEQACINQPAKEWLANWLTAHGFTPEEVAAITYTGGFSGYTEECGYYQYKNFGIEVHCRFRDIPEHYLPCKLHNWLKRNPEYKPLCYA